MSLLVIVIKPQGSLVAQWDAGTHETRVQPWLGIISAVWGFDVLKDFLFLSFVIIIIIIIIILFLKRFSMLNMLICAVQCQ